MWVTLTQMSFSLSAYVPWKKGIDKGEAGGYTQPSCTSGRGSNTFRALHPNMLPSHSWSCFTAEPLGIIRVAPEVNHVDFSQQSFERSRKFLLLWELSSLAQLTGAGPSSCVHTTTTPSQWPHQVGLESGMRHNQYLPWKFLIATKTALLSLGGSLG